VGGLQTRCMARLRACAMGLKQDLQVHIGMQLPARVPAVRAAAMPHAPQPAGREGCSLQASCSAPSAWRTCQLKRRSRLPSHWQRPSECTRPWGPTRMAAGHTNAADAWLRLLQRAAGEHGSGHATDGLVEVQACRGAPISPYISRPASHNRMQPRTGQQCPGRRYSKHNHLRWSGECREGRADFGGEDS